MLASCVAASSASRSSSTKDRVVVTNSSRVGQARMSGALTGGVCGEGGESVWRGEKGLEHIIGAIWTVRAPPPVEA